MWEYNTKYLSHSVFKYIEKYIGPSGEWVYKYAKDSKEKANKQEEQKEQKTNFIEKVSKKAEEIKQRAIKESKNYAREMYDLFSEQEFDMKHYKRLYDRYSDVYGEDQAKQIEFAVYHMYLADIGNIEPKPIIEENRWLLNT